MTIDFTENELAYLLWAVRSMHHNKQCSVAEELDHQASGEPEYLRVKDEVNDMQHLENLEHKLLKYTDGKLPTEEE